MFYHDYNPLAETKINLRVQTESRPHRMNLPFYLLGFIRELFAGSSNIEEQRDRDIIENDLYIFCIPVK